MSEGKSLRHPLFFYGKEIRYMKIGIIGAGAMGCLYASMLSEKNDVKLFDVSEKAVSAINEHGIIMTSKENKEKKAYRVSAYFSGKFDEKLDLIIVFVKDTATKAALESNADLIKEDTLLLSLQNGLGNFEIMEEFADKSRILLGTTKHNCVTLSFGEIYHSGAGITHIGSPIGNNEAAKKISDMFNESGIETEACTDVKKLLWQKLFINMTINSVTALLDSHISVIADSAGASSAAKKLIDEAVSVAKADGEEFDNEKVYKDVIETARRLGTGKASMCQDMENKRKTEIDFINGAVVKLGRKYGIETPFHSLIVDLIHAKESLF